MPATASPVEPVVVEPAPSAAVLAPSLPGLTPAAPSPAPVPGAAAPGLPPATGGMSEYQLQAAALAQSGAAPGPARRVPRFSLAQRIGRTMIAAVLVAGLGAGARFGWQAYQDRQDESSASESSASFLPPIGDPLPTGPVVVPAGGFTDASVEITDEAGVVTSTMRIQSSLVTQNSSVQGYLLDAETGSGVDYESQIRGDAVYFRETGAADWADISAEAAENGLIDEVRSLGTSVYTFDDVVPSEAIPFVTVSSESDEQLAVAPLATTSATTAGTEPGSVNETAADGGVAGTSEAVPDGSSRPSGPITVRHYRLAFDVEAFASAEPFAQAQWWFEFFTDDSTIDVWVDDAGVVRQLRMTVGAETIVVTLHDVVDALPGFQDVLLSTLGTLVGAGE